MPVVATWIREKDEPFFAPWLEGRPGVIVRNARREPEWSPADFARMDGLLLSGGPDIGAEFLHQPIPDPSLIEEPEPARDRWEFAAAQAALERGLPIFAICKGHQVLNVALGGTLFLDIRGHDDPADRSRNVQPLRYDSSAPAERRFERVNSSHHQAIEQLGDGLAIEAWHASDGIIEQVRLQHYPAGCVGVQYHPERDGQYAALFEDFLRQVVAHGR